MPRAQSEAVRTRVEDGILEVTLDRPKANAIDLATSREMGKVFAAFRDDADLRVAIVRTEGDKFFSAGWDLKAAADGDAVDGDYGVGGFGGLQELPDLNKPVIAAVHGLAMGGGFELALSCDLIYASEATQFGLPEINAGTLADAATIKLPKRMPYHVAMELLLTGRWMAASEARALGRGQRGAARRGGGPGPRLGDRPAARLRPTAGLRRDQGDRPGRGVAAVPGGPGPGHDQHPPDGGDALHLRGRPRGVQGLRREAEAGLEGPLSTHPLTTKETPVNRNVMITCALTGAGDTVGRSEHVPVTPEQIAESGIAAARAGATIVHIHVRDPQTGKGSREVALYREVVERIRASDVDVIINTTAGMGGDLVLDPHDPTTFVEGTDLVSGVDRLPHVEDLLPDICTLDCGSLNFGEGSLVYVSTPDMLREGAKKIQELGVRCEMEIFDTGHLWFAKTLVEEGLIDAPAMYQLCMGIPYGAPADPLTLAAMVNQLPEDAVWASFALGPMQMPWVAQSVLLGGHVRVGLEDNLYLSKGVKATNAQLVERARTIVESMGAHVATPDEGREILALKPDEPAAHRRTSGPSPASAPA